MSGAGWKRRHPHRPLPLPQEQRRSSALDFVAICAALLVVAGILIALALSART